MMRASGMEPPHGVTHPSIVLDLLLHLVCKLVGWCFSGSSRKVAPLGIRLLMRPSHVRTSEGRGTLVEHVSCTSVGLRFRAQARPPKDPSARRAQSCSELLDIGWTVHRVSLYMPPRLSFLKAFKLIQFHSILHLLSFLLNFNLDTQNTLAVLYAFLHYLIR